MSLVQGIKGVGLAQLVYYRQPNGFKAAFVRLYNYFNRDNSKVYQEYSLGTVVNWETLSVINLNRGITLTCGSRMILLQISLYPTLQINTTSATPITLNLISKNNFSITKLVINARNNFIYMNIPALLLLIIFLWILTIWVIWVQVILNFISKNKIWNKEKLDLNAEQLNKNKQQNETDDDWQENTNGSLKIHDTIRNSFNSRDHKNTNFETNPNDEIENQNVMVMEYDDTTEKETKELENWLWFKINHTISEDSEVS